MAGSSELLRFAHIKEKCRRMRFVCTGRVRESCFYGSWKERDTLCFMTEDVSKDVTCTNVIEIRKFAASGSLMENQEVVSCSCDIHREGSNTVESKCAHRSILVCNTVMMGCIRERLSTAFGETVCSENEDQCFGTWVDVKGYRITVGEEEEDAIICTQLYQKDGRSLTKRGKTIAKRWSFWNVFDVNDPNFVCCIRSAMRSGINVTKLNCTQCKHGAGRTCRNEEACGRILQRSGTVNVNENGDLQELNGSNDDADVVPMQDSSDTEYSERDEEGIDESCIDLAENSYCDEAVKGTNGNASRSAGSRKCIRQPLNVFSSKKYGRCIYVLPNGRSPSS